MVKRRELTDDEIAMQLKLLDDEQLNGRVDSEIKRIWKGVKDTYEVDIDNQDAHDDLIDQCIIAFSPKSKCCEEAEYKFVTVEPLSEKKETVKSTVEPPFEKKEKVKSFDVLMVNESEKLGIFVECKSGVSAISKEVEDVYEKIKDLKANLNYLQEKIGCSLQRQEYAICIPSDYSSQVRYEIGRREKTGLVDCDDDPLLLVWEVHMFRGNPSVKLNTEIDSPRKKERKQHMNSHLTRLLSDGIDTSKMEVVDLLYPSSHPLKKASKFIEWMVNMNYELRTTPYLFERNMPSVYFRSRKILPHYAFEEIGQEVADRFVREGLDKGLLSESEDEKNKLQFSSKGRTRKTILETYKRAFVEESVNGIARRKAQRTVFEKYRKDHPAIDNWPGS